MGHEIIVLDSFQFKHNDFLDYTIYDLRNMHIESTEDNILLSKYKLSNIDDIAEVFGIVFCQAETKDYVLSLYNFIYLERALPPGFFFNDIVYHQNTIILSFTNQYKKRKIKKRTKAKALFIGDGVGDFFILNTLLHHFFKNHRKLDYEFHIITYETCSAKNIIKQFYNDIKTYVLRDGAYLEIFYKYMLRSSHYDKCYNIILNGTRFLNFINQKHVYNIYCQQLGIEQHVYYDDKKWIMSKINNEILNNEKDYIDSILSKNPLKKKIGFQFWTGPLEQPNPRCWDKENVVRFIELCKNKYDLINLTPYPVDYNIEVINAQSLSIMGILYLISKLYMVVAIDSLSGHAAAMLDIPSFTLWSSFQTPLCVFSENTNVSIRAIRNNISIVPKNGIETIKADVLYHIINTKYPQKIKANPNWITYNDSKEGYDIINI